MVKDTGDGLMSLRQQIADNAIKVRHWLGCHPDRAGIFVTKLSYNRHENVIAQP